MTDDLDRSRTRLLHLLEQASAHMFENAEIIARYYAHLVEKEIPHDLAVKLVLRMDLRLNGALPRKDEE